MGCIFWRNGAKVWIFVVFVVLGVGRGRLSFRVFDCFRIVRFRYVGRNYLFVFIIFFENFGEIILGK